MHIEAHPAAELFPLLAGADYEVFKSDIAERGLIEPIWLCEGKILDGRNRYRACTELGVEIQTREYTGDSPVHFVWSLNGTRRHLTTTQLSTIGVEMLPMLKEEAKKRLARTQFAGRNDRGEPVRVSAPTNSEEPKDNGTGEAVAQAAKIVGTGTTVIYEAKRVKENAPELFEQMKSGKVSTNKAVKIMQGKVKALDPNARFQPREKRAADIKRLAHEGYRSEQIADELGISAEHIRRLARDESITLPDAQIGRSRKINVRRVVAETVNGLSGYASGLQLINGGLKELEKSEAADWAESLTESLKPLNRLRKQLLEIANG